MRASGPGAASPIFLPVLTNASPVQRPAATAPPVALTGPSAAPPSAVPAPSAGESATVASTPPAGADPKLWSMLTTDEQQFFHQIAALGPLTYGARPGQGSPDAPVGQRVDVRG
jgi:hypothetical protein